MLTIQFHQLHIISLNRQKNNTFLYFPLLILFIESFPSIQSIPLFFLLKSAVTYSSKTILRYFSDKMRFEIFVDGATLIITKKRLTNNIFFILLNVISVEGWQWERGAGACPSRSRARNKGL